jgi:hypothetical protein
MATVTVRLDPETERILAEMTQDGREGKSRVIREALRTHWNAVRGAGAPTSWEVYASLGIPRSGGRKHNRARRVKQLIKERLRAKSRSGTL